MISLALLPLLALPALAAPVRLPMPMAHRRDLAPAHTPSERGLLGGLGLDLGVDVDLGLPGLNLGADVGLDLNLAPILDLNLGVDLDLTVDSWLKCNRVQGPFGGRDYDLGCSCIGTGGGLLLGVDVDAVVNVDGLDAWVRAQVSLEAG
jgi:hypothetical protein